MGDEGADAGLDAGVDAGLDAGFDAGVDAGLDAGVDAGVDAGLDAGVDAGVDASLDAGVDAGPLPVCGGQWCWTNPLPQGNALRAVWANALSDVWAVGDRGTTLHFDGVDWVAEPVSARLFLTGVWGSGSRRVATAGRMAFLTFDGGSSNGILSGALLERDSGAWTIADLSTPLTAVSGTSTVDVWVVGGDGGLHSNGSSWQPTVPPARYTTVWATAQSDVWALGSGSVHWDGIAWSLVATPQSVMSVWASSSHDAWAATDSNGLSHWDGGTWVTEYTTLNGQSRIWGTAPNDVWAAGNGAPILHFNGSTWTPTSGDVTVSGMGGTSPSDAWAVGASGTLLHWNGLQWRPWSRNAAGPLGFTCSGLWGASASDVWAVGGNVLLHGNGTTWTKLTSPQPNATLSALWGSGPNDVWAVGDVAMHWNGSAWSVPARSPRVSLNTIWGSGPNDVWAAGWNFGSNAGELFRWNGTQWNSVSVGTSFFPSALVGTAANDVWLAGGSTTLLHWDGSRWSSTQPWAGTDGLWVGSAADMWSWNDTAHAFVHWNGLSWSSIPSPMGALASFYGFTGTGSQDVWAYGYDRNSASGVLAHWDGNQWEMEALPAVPALGAVWTGAQGDVWVGGADSALLRRR